MSESALRARIERDRAVLNAAMVDHRLRDGSSVRVARFGSGPTVLCVPMVQQLGFIYMPQVEHLMQDHQVVLYEPRLSRTARVSVADRAAELREVVELLGDRPVHLLAWSDAGAAAYLVGLQRPDRVASLALLGLADRYAFPQPVQALARNLYARPIERFVPHVLCSALLAMVLSGPRFSWRWVLREAQGIEGLPHLLKHSILPLVMEHKPHPQQLPMPSLLIGGDDDALVTVEQMQRMAVALGTECQFVALPGGEHALGYATPDEVNAILSHFYVRQEADVEGSSRL